MFFGTPGVLTEDRTPGWFRFGLDGQACVQRLVCEINFAPMKIGLLGDIINTIFL